MQVLGMTIEANEKIYQIAREETYDDGAQVRMVRITWPAGTSDLHRGIQCREDCFGLAQRIARHAYGENRCGGIRAGNSTISEITDAVERVAGC